VILGIDAHCLRAGGGITHLREVLKVADPGSSGFSKVLIWSGKKTLESIEPREWLHKLHDPLLDRDIASRAYWSSFKVSRLARRAGCSVLWVPGCSFAGSFRPFVAMSRNMLPFEWRELVRYRFSPRIVKLIVLRVTNSRTYRRSDGMIYLTRYALDSVGTAVGRARGDSRIIPHGVEEQFSSKPKRERGPLFDPRVDVLRVLYVSAIDLYKHQWNVVEAVGQLQREGLRVELTLIGPAFSEGETKLYRALKRFAGTPGTIKYLGAVKHAELPHHYQAADIFVFASSCENLPNILLEAMATGLPIASSSRGPMPEVLRDGGLYFDPEKPPEIAAAIRALATSPALAAEKSRLALRYGSEYTWQRCARESFDYLATVATRFGDSPDAMRSRPQSEAKIR
jgi:glycosyltransferase involved in cell wall biosynthesis